MIAAIYAEWTKYWTVRGWVIGMLIAILATLGTDLLGHPSGGDSSLPLGPGGGAVNDTFYFVHQPLAGNGSLTVRVTSLTGLVQPGSVSAASPRWLRLVRSGDTITGYDSPDGAGWTRVGTVTLPGLPATVQAGLSAASPLQNRAITQSLGGSSGAGTPTLATGTFDHLRGLPGTWTGTQIGGVPAGTYPTAPGGYQQARGTLTVTGSGGISPAVPGGDFGANISHALIGTFAGLIAVAVVAAMFITAEYRRGLIRTTLAAIGLPLGTSQLHSSGVFIYPVTTLTQVRLVAGTAYPQVGASCTIVGGYYPLPPWAGFAVLCAWAAAAVALAAALLRRRDA